MYKYNRLALPNYIFSHAQDVIKLNSCKVWGIDGIVELVQKANQENPIILYIFTRFWNWLRAKLQMILSMLPNLTNVS